MVFFKIDYFVTKVLLIRLATFLFSARVSKIWKSTLLRIECKDSRESRSEPTINIYDMLAAHCKKSWRCNRFFHLQSFKQWSVEDKKLLKILVSAQRRLDLNVPPKCERQKVHFVQPPFIWQQDWGKGFDMQPNGRCMELVLLKPTKAADPTFSEWICILTAEGRDSSISVA